MLDNVIVKFSIIIFFVILISSVILYQVLANQDKVHMINRHIELYPIIINHYFINQDNVMLEIKNNKIGTDSEIVIKLIISNILKLENVLKV